MTARTVNDSMAMRRKCARLWAREQRERLALRSKLRKLGWAK